jgi:hypothetical protein
LHEEVVGQSQIFDQDYPYTCDTAKKSSYRENQSQNPSPMDRFIDGKDAMNKFAMSLLIVKEMARRHPYLRQVATKIINDS